MKRAPTATRAGKKPTKDRPRPGIDVDAATQVVMASLEDDKAEEIVTIDIRGKSSFADMLVVASGRSSHHVGALADHIVRKLNEAGAKDIKVEGMPHADWVLIGGLVNRDGERAPAMAVVERDRVVVDQNSTCMASVSRRASR